MFLSIIFLCTVVLDLGSYGVQQDLVEISAANTVKDNPGLGVALSVAMISASVPSPV